MDSLVTPRSAPPPPVTSGADLQTTGRDHRAGLRPPDKGSRAASGSLYRRLAGVFILLVFILGVSSAFLFTIWWRTISDESSQRSNWNLAETLRPRIEGLLWEPGDDMYRNLEYVLQDLKLLRPDVDIYILNSKGKILYAGADYAGVVQSTRELTTDTVATAPLEEFLKPDREPQLPLLGEDPLKPEEPKPFSASRLKLGNGKEKGYLYILLGASSTGLTMAAVRESHAARGGLYALALLLLGTSAAGLLAFRFLTRPLRHLFVCMNRFANGEPEIRAQLTPTGEIGLVADAFNRMADTISEQVKSLERSDELRRNLVANLSHDLRRPLTSIVGYMDRLKQSPAGEKEVERSLDVMNRNIHVIKRMADELFDLSRLEAKERQPMFEVFSLSDLVNDVILRFGPASEEQSVALSQHEEKTVPLVVGDPRMIELVLGNLIENAIRHTQAGGKVDVILGCEGGRVLAEIRDTGVGIPEDELPHIFERFYQARTPGSGGSGLGLAIVQRILKLHGSEIRVESHVGKGTTFCFSLERAPRS